jgi:hypothetical protein
VQSFFQELGRKLAEQWVSLLVLPGLLFVAAACAGRGLGQRRALDRERGVHLATEWTAGLARLPVSSRLVVAAGLLLAAAGLGLVVRALAGATRRLWLGAWPWPLAAAGGRLTARRQRRWQREAEHRRELENPFPFASRSADQQHRINTVAARLNRLSPARPARPTWMGDRIQSVEQVALHRGGLDLSFAWPRLWLVLPDGVRAEIGAAYAAFARATAVGSWAWPYLALGAVWWPAALVGAGIGATGWAAARTAVADLAALSEAAVDLHARTLALALGVGRPETVGPITLAEGEAITALVRKGR